MNNEFLTIWQCGAAGIGLIATSVLYSIGGRAGGPGKWVRRFLGSFILAATVCGIAVWRGVFVWGLLGVWPLLALGFSMGYGADAFWGKIIRRTIYAATVLLSGALCAYLLDGWAVFIPHVGVAGWSVYLGVKNPLDAPAEEFFVCMVLNLFLIAYAFV